MSISDDIFLHVPVEWLLCFDVRQLPRGMFCVAHGAYA